MSDILISFQPDHSNDINRAKDLMKYYDSVKVVAFNFENASFAISRSDDLNLWGPYENKEKGIFVALTGRIALDPEIWTKQQIKSSSGKCIACEYIAQEYLKIGEDCVKKLNGNYNVFIYDYKNEVLIIGTDRCGSVPIFRSTNNTKQLVIGSHPDIVASIANQTELDNISCAEFVITGKLTPPYTYYRNIKFLSSGTIHKFSRLRDKDFEVKQDKYFDFPYNFDHGLKENDLIEELVNAFKKAVNRRSLSIFGKTGVSMSAGLDSRAVLCSAGSFNNLVAFSFYDEENNELQLAKRIAEEVGVPFIPIKRDFEHYGNSLIEGVRISGGMSDFGNNHYLGVRSKLIDYKIDNILSGFHCDYLFKGLAYNRKENKLLRRFKLSKFDYSWYMPVYWGKSKFKDDVKNRLDSVFNTECNNLSYIERQRTFPLCYEPDNFQTVVPQRVLGWYLPTIDKDIIDVYLKIPPSLKVNIDFFNKVTSMICGKDISRIKNNNTNAPLNAGIIEVSWNKNIRAIRSKLSLENKRGISVDSWPNWNYYLKNSIVINRLWADHSNASSEFITEIIGEDIKSTNPYEYINNNKARLLRRVLTLKTWFQYKIV